MKNNAKLVTPEMVHLMEATFWHNCSLVSKVVIDFNYSWDKKKFELRFQGIVLWKIVTTEMEHLLKASNLWYVELISYLIMDLWGI